METTQSFINGQSVSSADTYDNIDPATGRVVVAIADGCTGEDPSDCTTDVRRAKAVISMQTGGPSLYATAPAKKRK